MKRTVTTARRSRAVKKRMQALLAGLEYDFSQFTLEGFARWLEQRRGRRILFAPWSMPPTLSRDGRPVLMQALSDYVGTVVAWAVTLLMLPVLFRDGGQSTRLSRAWLFALSYSLLGTFEIDGVYLALDRAQVVTDICDFVHGLGPSEG